MECSKKDCINRIYTGKCTSCGTGFLNYLTKPTSLINLLANHSISIKFSTLNKDTNPEPYSDITDCKVDVEYKGDIKSKVVGLDYVQSDENLIKIVSELVNTD
jgi:hypothetical protein